jgi:hypothetical protein
MQAIETKYLGPTSFRGARIKASCQAMKVTVSWDWSTSVDESHDAAARALIIKMGWFGTWVRGAKADGRGNVYVCLARERNSGIRFPHPQAVDPRDVLTVRAP